MLNRKSESKILKFKAQLKISNWRWEIKTMKQKLNQKFNWKYCKFIVHSIFFFAFIPPYSGCMAGVCTSVKPCDQIQENYVYQCQGNPLKKACVQGTPRQQIWKKQSKLKVCSHASCDADI